MGRGVTIPLLILFARQRCQASTGRKERTLKVWILGTFHPHTFLLFFFLGCGACTFFSTT